MNEENKGASKNKWSQIFRKKWFFPALYLTIAALLLAAVVWYQNLEQVPVAEEENQNEEVTEDYMPNQNGEEAAPVLEQQELIEMPVADQEQAEIVTKFYDYNASQEDQENALVLYNNRFYQSTGVDIASASDESFGVTASLSGQVTEVKEDPLLGNVVVLSHDNDVMTYYASLDEVTVTAGDEVVQGDEIGTAGKNIFGKDNGTHVHFELRKDGEEVNPESYFNQPVSSLETPKDEQVAEDSNTAEDAEASESEESSTDAEANESEESAEATEEENTEESGEASDSEETPGGDDEDGDSEENNDSTEDNE